MVLLKDDKEKRDQAIVLLTAVISELDDIDSKDAHNVCSWYLKKAKMIKKQLLKQRFHKLPNDMNQGDIVKVNFGINIGSELSDTNENSEGHFAMIWKQQGQNFIVIPLTKKPQPKENVLGINLGVVSGLPLLEIDGERRAIDTYAKIDGVRSVHLRRILRIDGVEDGKIVYDNYPKLREINNIISEHLLINVQENVLTK